MGDTIVYTYYSHNICKQLFRYNVLFATIYYVMNDEWNRYGSS